MIPFEEFYREIHLDGRRPYPWQSELARRLVEGRAPRLIAAPTGAGKTATIDALVWALAAQADRDAAARSVGVRAIWAIDRRILVDEVYGHAESMARRLHAALADAGDPLREIAQRLRELAGGGEAAPLVATRWRGALRLDNRSKHPLQPEIITSTLAQVGSRLLFRGYGVGERSLPLAAALTAVDATICLDEAHLAEPLRQTVSSIVDRRSDESVPLPALRAITLTATPGGDICPDDVLAVSGADIEALGRRWTGEKLMRLVEPDGLTLADQRKALVAAVEQHLDEGAPSVACVVNSVRMAVEVRAALSAACPDADLLLLVGPQRPADRALLIERHRAVLFAAAAAERPLVCVATQTFEVGLDADVAALVTQSASAGAIVQRIGRLNRAGNRAGRGTIVRDGASDLYADEEPDAWRWLESMRRDDGYVDVSVAALSAADNRPRQRVRYTAPSLTDETAALFAQTSPRPMAMADPDPETFIHGVERPPAADVSVCWRVDLRPEDDTSTGREYREALLRLAPPQPDELVGLSIGRARALVAARLSEQRSRRRLATAILDSPDVEGMADLAAGWPAGDGDGAVPARFVVLRGGDHHEVDASEHGPIDQADLRPRDIRPGDLLVLPTAFGGYHDAVAPEDSREVLDVAADVRAAQGVDVVPTAVRLSIQVLRLSLDADVASRIVTKLDQLDRRDALDDAALRTTLEPLGTWTAPWIDRRLRIRRVTPLSTEPLGLEDVDDDLSVPWELSEEPAARGDDVGAAADVERAAALAFVVVVGDPLTDEELRSSPPPTLDEHCTAVEERARLYAEALQLPAGVAAAVGLAARAHDLGKADPRIQAFFRGGASGFLETPIAKSVFGTSDVIAARAARANAGLPRGLRHEIASVAALLDAVRSNGLPDGYDQADIELALHLVGTHHGLGRPLPLAPELEGSHAREFQAVAAGMSGIASGDGQDGWDDGAWLRRFFAVLDRFGPWGTAYLEALVVLADRTVSAEGR